MTYVRHVHANLMGASGLNLRLQQRELCKGLRDLKYSVGGSARASAKHCHASAVMRAAPYTSIYLASLLRHPPVNERKVRLEDLPVAKLVRQSLVRQVIFSYDKQAGCLFINSMNDAGANAARRFRERVEVIDESVGKRARFYARARMHDHSRRLIDHDQIIIFVNDIQPDRLRNDLDGRGLRQINFDEITCAQAIAGLDGKLVYQYIAVFYRPLNSRAADFKNVRSEEGIEARAGRVVVDS
jgi:hypothetical protein